MAGEIAVKTIEEKQDSLDLLSKELFEHPEGPFCEKYASEKVADLLEAEGFIVEKEAGGVKTAIRAVWGNGKPVIGLLGEYDALPGLSQKAVPHREAVTEGGYGHGCGHNLLAATTVGCAIGMKAEMEARKIPGTIVFYGCPAEEVLTGKPFMARGGCFRELDLALAWHPSRVTRASAQGTCGCNSVKFHFKGTAAHAAFDPWNGRSALDAVSLLNTGAEYMREHIPPEVRIHYAITEGGTAPNIVPENACVWYFVRALKREHVNEVYEWLKQAAQGAAMMTQTKLEVEFLGGCYPRRDNRVIASVLDESLRSIRQEEYTEEEIQFARKLNGQSEKSWKKTATVNKLPDDTQIHTGVGEISEGFIFDSSDVGDVAHIVPTGFFYTATYNLGAPGHSWQSAACAGASIGRKGMHYGAKAMAMSGIKLMENENLRKKAREEFLRDMEGRTYQCPIPESLEIKASCE